MENENNDPRTVLVVDDDIVDLKIMERFFLNNNYPHLLAKNAADGLLLYHKHYPKIIFIDLLLPDMNGITLMEEIIREDPEVSIVIATGHASVETAVEAIKKGACDYITKPIDMYQLSLLTERLVKSQQVLLEKNLLQARLDELFGFHNFIGQSQQIKNVIRQILQVARTSATALITGESGTGKELCANAIHQSSPRKNKPFIKLNCAALPENIIESELFGHEKGAFTSAIQKRIGKFELADGGTIFLDEIGDLSISIQAKLLRVLENQEFERIGGNQTIKVDVRLVAATNRDLRQAVEKGLFREDLFYRLNVVNIHIPPLRERREDIPVLLTHFLQHFAEQMNKPIKSISAKAQALLNSYSWPGNVRELVNTIERAVVFCESSTVTERDLPDQIAGASNDPANSWNMPLLPLAQMEKKLIERVLIETNWNLRRAAKILNIHRGTLYSKIEKHGIKKNKLLMAFN
ncbi:MAG: sigma-54-dependent Fis family transcriptional regulator [Calditrichaeota bacterium]|nr:sigma-54-dependent Fis family transcriptional regulator [Calditrichota bacterium]